MGNSPQEKKVDIDKALGMLNIVEEWGRRPENKDQLALALSSAENSLLALVLTGAESGYFSNTPPTNQFFLDKMRIAFEMGYYSRALQNEI